MILTITKNITLSMRVESVTAMSPVIGIVYKTNSAITKHCVLKVLDHRLGQSLRKIPELLEKGYLVHTPPTQALS